MDTTENGSRRRVEREQFQRITRLPDVKDRPIRPGDVVRLKDFEPGANGDSLSGKVRRVRSLTCAVTEREQPRAIWRVHLLPDGRSVTADQIERHATAEEARGVPR